MIDHSYPVRKGEELNQKSLEKYLQQHLPDLTLPLTIEQFPSGFSNLTYLLKVENRELVLRRPPFGSRVKSAHDMGREYHCLSHLYKFYPKVPNPILYCEDKEIIGAPFYIMERLNGVVLRKDMLEVNIDETTAAKLGEIFIDNLATLHTLDYKEMGLTNWGRPDGYMQRQVEGWIKRYYGSQTDTIDEMEELAKWLPTQIPKQSVTSLIHNDYKYDNVVLNPQFTEIIGVLDWEMATIGDPLSDLGTTLGYWVNCDDPKWVHQLSMVPTNIAGSPTRQDLVIKYREKTNYDTSNIIYYYCFALFKIAVIAQQIYYRYKEGYTQDQRFAELIHYVRGFSKRATIALSENKY